MHLLPQRSAAICMQFSPNDRRVMMESLFQHLRDVTSLCSPLFPFSADTVVTLFDLMPSLPPSVETKRTKGVRAKGGLFVSVIYALSGFT